MLIFLSSIHNIKMPSSLPVDVSLVVRVTELCVQIISNFAYHFIILFFSFTEWFGLLYLRGWPLFHCRIQHIKDTNGYTIPKTFVFLFFELHVLKIRNKDRLIKTGELESHYATRCFSVAANKIRFEYRSLHECWFISAEGSSYLFWSPVVRRLSVCL